jgi:3-methyl-2-oxobutanoate hydroxymethyltransferase
VFHDLVGLTIGHTPKFARQYANLSGEISRAVEAYCSDVRSGGFPSDAESFHSSAELRDQLLARQRT